MMYYLSLVDPDRAEGARCVGTTVLKADSPEEAIAIATHRGWNKPNYDVAIWPLNGCNTVDDLPGDGKDYYDRLVTYDELKSRGEKNIGELRDSGHNEMADLAESLMMNVCPDCNHGRTN